MRWRSEVKRKAVCLLSLKGRNVLINWFNLDRKQRKLPSGRMEFSVRSIFMTLSIWSCLIWTYLDTHERSFCKLYIKLSTKLLTSVRKYFIYVIYNNSSQHLVILLVVNTMDEHKNGVIWDSTRKSLKIITMQELHEYLKRLLHFAIYFYTASLYIEETFFYKVKYLQLESFVFTLDLRLFDLIYRVRTTLYKLIYNM